MPCGGTFAGVPAHVETRVCPCSAWPPLAHAPIRNCLLLRISVMAMPPMRPPTAMDPMASYTGLPVHHVRQVNTAAGGEVEER